MNASKEINTKKLTDWLSQNINSQPPYDFHLIAAGGSNLTYRISDSQNNLFALRRPPMAGVLKSAHDMKREWKVMTALKNSPVPVPECLAYCDDPEIWETDFYVMEFVEGAILRDTKSVPDITPDSAMTATESLIQTQLQMHTLDVAAMGLGDLSKHEDYVGRQLKRWKQQIDAAKIRDLPVHQDLYERLQKAKPEESVPPGLVHGDYRFDNCVLGDDFKIAAVLDWELCTIGNPLADFIWSLQYWADPKDKFTWIPDAPTIADAFIDRQKYFEMYRDSSGWDFSAVDYYTIFSWWKQASIVEGVYARLLSGGGGGMSNNSRTEDISARVDYMLDHANSLAKGFI